MNCFSIWVLNPAQAWASRNSTNHTFPKQCLHWRSSNGVVKENAIYGSFADPSTALARSALLVFHIFRAHDFHHSAAKLSVAPLSTEKTARDQVFSFRLFLVSGYFFNDDVSRFQEYFLATKASQGAPKHKGAFESLPPRHKFIFFMTSNNWLSPKIKISMNFTHQNYFYRKSGWSVQSMGTFSTIRNWKIVIQSMIYGGVLIFRGAGQNIENSVLKSRIWVLNVILRPMWFLKLFCGGSRQHSCSISIYEMIVLKEIDEHLWKSMKIGENR